MIKDVIKDEIMKKLFFMERVLRRYQSEG